MGMIFGPLRVGDAENQPYPGSSSSPVRASALIVPDSAAGKCAVTDGWRGRPVRRSEKRSRRSPMGVNTLGSHAWTSWS